MASTSLKPSPKFPNNEEQSGKFSILVSPSGTLHLISKDRKNLFWSYHLDTTIRKADFEGADSYVDLEVDDGKINLYYKSSNATPDKIPSESWNDIESYVNNKKLKFEHFEDSLYFDFNSGTRLLDGHPRSEFILLERLACSISKFSSGDNWSLKFSKFRGTLIGEMGQIFTCDVHHECSDEGFIEYCKRFPAIRDLCFRNTLKGRNISEDPDPDPNPNSDILGNNFLPKTYSGFKAAVKTLVNTENITVKHQNLVLTNLHDNIVRFFGAELNQDGDVEFAFELHHYSLPAYFDQYRSSISLINILRGISEALNHLHKHGLCHGRLQPWKVLLTHQMQPRLCGIANCQPLDEEPLKNEELKRADFQAFAKVMAYCDIPDDMRVVIRNLDVYNGLSIEVLLSTIVEEESRDLITRLMQMPILPHEEFKLHPRLWPPFRWLGFLKDTSDNIHDYRNHELRKAINKSRADILGNIKDWRDVFPEELMKVMKERMIAILQRKISYMNQPSKNPPSMNDPKSGPAPVPAQPDPNQDQYHYSFQGQNPYMISTSASNPDLYQDPYQYMHQDPYQSSYQDPYPYLYQFPYQYPYQGQDQSMNPSPSMMPSTSQWTYMEPHTYTSTPSDPKSGPAPVPAQPDPNQGQNQSMNPSPSMMPSTSQWTDMEPRTYTSTPSDLLRFIRNIFNHSSAIAKDLTEVELKDFIQADQEFTKYLKSQFPSLLMVVHRLVSNNEEARSQLSRYFKAEG